MRACYQATVGPSRWHLIRVHLMHQLDDDVVRALLELSAKPFKEIKK